MKNNKSFGSSLFLLLLSVIVIGLIGGCSSEPPAEGLNILFQLKLKNQYNVHLLKTEGEYPDSIAVMPRDVVQPIWSPDRTRLLFAHDRNDHFDIAVADADGGNLRYLTADTADNVNLASWFPTGDRIVFSSNRQGKLDIYTLRLDDSTATPLPLVTGSGNKWHPIVTPNGARLLFVSDRTGRPRIWVLDFATNRQTMVLRPDSLSADFEPAISPDGKFLAYSSVRKGDDSENFDIILFDLINNTSEVIIASPQTDRWPRFSVEGKQILFHSDRTGTNALYIYDRATKQTRAINTGTINSSYGDW